MMLILAPAQPVVPDGAQPVRKAKPAGQAVIAALL
jgi:hypothetical protein